MGEDNLISFYEWKNHDYIIKNYLLLVYPRIINSINQIKFNTKNIIKIKAPIIQISSTLIRQMIRQNKNYQPLVPEPVFNYIKLNNLYRSLNL